MKPQRPPYPAPFGQTSWLMIGTLILVFVGLMATALLCLFALIQLGVIDQQLSLILFVAAVPMAAWIALDLETVELGSAPVPRDKPAVPLVHVAIDRLWLPGFDDTELPARRRLHSSASLNSPAVTPVPPPVSERSAPAIGTSQTSIHAVKNNITASNL